MHWPSGQEYQEIVQNPRFCFEDSDLKHAEPVLNRLGLPRPSSGNFATVFRLKLNGREWAVKCFTRRIPEIQKRYREIGIHLSKYNPDFSVKFEYIERGIRAQGTWLPILKMDWVEGITLERFIEQNLQQPRSIERLSNDWLTLLQSLSNVNVAHGDLQHGNVLICNNQIKLIDYDGMFVPSLKGAQSNEIGHYNYQHPFRAPRDYDLHLDNFAGLVIYASLKAVSIDPSLWRSVRTDEDGLLFKKIDYQSPEKSDCFRRLTAHSDETIRNLVLRIKSSCGLPIENVQPVFSIVPRTPRTGLPDWIKDHVNNNKPQVTSCPKCGKALTKCTSSKLMMTYWECSAAPSCKYRRDDLDGLQARSSGMVPEPATSNQKSAGVSGTPGGPTAVPPPSSPIPPAPGINTNPGTGQIIISTGTNSSSPRTGTTPVQKITLTCNFCGHITRRLKKPSSIKCSKCGQISKL